MDSKHSLVNSNYDDVRIAFVGAGNMALSMAKGFVRNGEF